MERRACIWDGLEGDHHVWGYNRLFVLRQIRRVRAAGSFSSEVVISRDISCE